MPKLKREPEGQEVQEILLDNQEQRPIEAESFGFEDYPELEGIE